MWQAWYSGRSGILCGRWPVVRPLRAGWFCRPVLPAPRPGRLSCVYSSMDSDTENGGRVRVRCAWPATSCSVRNGSRVASVLVFVWIHSLCQFVWVGLPGMAKYITDATHAHRLASEMSPAAWPIHVLKLVWLYPLPLGGANLVRKSRPKDGRIL